MTAVRIVAFHMISMKFYFFIGCRQFSKFTAVRVGLYFGDESLAGFFAIDRRLPGRVRPRRQHMHSYFRYLTMHIVITGTFVNGLAAELSPAADALIYASASALPNYRLRKLIAAEAWNAIITRISPWDSVFHFSAVSCLCSIYKNSLIGKTKSDRGHFVKRRWRNRELLTNVHGSLSVEAPGVTSHFARACFRRMIKRLPTLDDEMSFSWSSRAASFSPQHLLFSPSTHMSKAL